MKCLTIRSTIRLNVKNRFLLDFTYRFSLTIISDVFIFDNGCLFTDIVYFSRVKLKCLLHKIMNPIREARLKFVVKSLIYSERENSSEASRLRVFWEENYANDLIWLTKVSLDIFSNNWNLIVIFHGISWLSHHLPALQEMLSNSLVVSNDMSKY